MSTPPSSLVQNNPLRDVCFRSTEPEKCWKEGKPYLQRMAHKTRQTSEAGVGLCVPDIHIPWRCLYTGVYIEGIGYKGWDVRREKIRKQITYQSPTPWRGGWGVDMTCRERGPDNPWGLLQGWNQIHRVSKNETPPHRSFTRPYSAANARAHYLRTVSFFIFFFFFLLTQVWPEILFKVETRFCLTVSRNDRAFLICILTNQEHLKRYSIFFNFFAFFNALK